MIHVILAAHTGLGKAMLETAATIGGATEGVKTVKLYPRDGTEDVKTRCATRYPKRVKMIESFV